ncbi:MAG: hypothetical protein COU22_01440 [Candidatus Komeilibacteria bacterium CG10_big_fil_rev_8_21_14_0_10_41_13]|uniref:Uncharacterized protein n=1 Tax=Candidatus Komeilibacteria bacterium CG10_big_fil_rev_8_21_14_0_10_41_13 TaxID=1974476 RepID=A0A2M6WCU8_9BACT|nr:MAG: hypothetical protein COU22_01440 [Candidatus Komeilibacteria bacterium CG10_big_fil_rev_8_21_14_0_10_41_13]
MNKQILQSIKLNKQERYIIGKSLIDSWGYPYKPKKIKFEFDFEEYKRIDEKLDQNNHELEINDLPVILNSLEMLYYENGDLEALYNNVTKNDVKILHDKLEKIYKENSKPE